jgi:hypothetical protein
MARKAKYGNAVVETGFTTETSGGFLLLNEGVNFSVSEGEIK